MNPAPKKKITIEVLVQAPREIVWKRWTTPEDIIKWNHASDDWHTPHAKNDLRAGGEFLFRMEAKNGSYGFDFGGVYDQVKVQEFISYSLGDERKVEILFTSIGTTTKVVETFDAENQNSIELQRSGWQAILNNFKNHTENTL
jgi:uncharacterized protein YndB with AHSA1/START domain